MDDGAIGWLHLVADILHLLAAGAWVGALAGLTMLVLRSARRVDASHLQLTHRALRKFGPVGTIVGGTIVVTGAINGWRLVGMRSIPTIVATLHGRLLIAKLALFLGMLALAALKRFRLVPGFATAMIAVDRAMAPATLQRTIVVEAL